MDGLITLGDTATPVDSDTLNIGGSISLSGAGVVDPTIIAPSGYNDGWVLYNGTFSQISAGTVDISESGQYQIMCWNSLNQYVSGQVTVTLT